MRMLQKKKRLFHLFNALLVVILITIGLIFEIRISRNAEIDERFGDFFESKQDYDVLFFGSSHMVHSVDTMQLWKEYGITSYNFGGFATWIPSSYWVFRNAIEVHKPKIAVMEVFGAWNNKSEQDYSMLHYTFDAFPISLLKNEAIRDLTEDKEVIQELLFPFSIYHTKWELLDPSTIKKGMFLKPNRINKGTVFLYKINKEPTRLTVQYTYPEKKWLTDSQQYLIRFIEDCKERGIQPVLLYVPFDVEANTDYVRSIAKMKEVPFIDMYVESNEYVNYMTDFADGAHLNYSGASKVTKVIGNAICEMGISFEHPEAEKDNWNSEYHDYKEDLKSRIRTTESLDEEMLLLTNTDEHVEVVLNDDIKAAVEKQAHNLFCFDDTAFDKTATYRKTMQRLRVDSCEKDDSICCYYNDTNWSFGYIEIQGIDGTKNYKVSFNLSENKSDFMPRFYKDEELSDTTKLVLAIDGGNKESYGRSDEYFVLSNIRVTEQLENTVVDCILEICKNQMIDISDEVAKEKRIIFRVTDNDGILSTKELNYE